MSHCKIVGSHLVLNCSSSTYLSCWRPLFCTSARNLWQTYDLLQSLLNLVLEWLLSFNEKMQKLCAKLSKGDPHGTSEKGGPEATASIASPNIHHWILHYTEFLKISLAALDFACIPDLGQRLLTCAKNTNIETMLKQIPLFESWSQ